MVLLFDKTSVENKRLNELKRSASASAAGATGPGVGDGGSTALSTCQS